MNSQKQSAQILHIKKPNQADHRREHEGADSFKESRLQRQFVQCRIFLEDANFTV